MLKDDAKVARRLRGRDDMTSERERMTGDLSTLLVGADKKDFSLGRILMQMIPGEPEMYIIKCLG